MPPKAALDELLQFIRILILDDDEETGISTQLLLQQRGFPFVEFTPVLQDAWEKLPHVNILLIDHYLGDAPENGIDFTRRAKEKYLENLDVIIYSGSVKELVENAKSAGATACLEKPLIFDYLELWIRETARRIWYEKILHAIPDEVIVIDPSEATFGKIHFANKTKKDLFERGLPLEYDYCWKRFERRGESNGPCLGCPSHEAKNDRCAVRNYWDYTTPDGRAGSVDIHAAPLFDQVGEIRGIIETCRDRTDRNIVNKKLRQIEAENDWFKRLQIFLKGFTELGYERVRFYQKHIQNNEEVYQGVIQLGMPDDFDIRQYRYSALSDVPTRIISEERFPTLFLVKQKPDYNWLAHANYPHVYRVSDTLVPNNHVLEKRRWIDIPLIADRKIIAKVSVEPRDPAFFISTHDLELLNYYADWAGQALWNSQQRERLRLNHATNQLIIEMNQKISKMPIHSRWLYLAARRVCEVLDTSTCCIFRLQGEGKNARLVRQTTSARDIHSRWIKNIRHEEEYKIGQHIIGDTFKSGRIHIEQNLAALAEEQRRDGGELVNLKSYDYYCDLIGEKISNAMLVVFHSGKNRAGVIRVLNKRRSDIFGNRDFTTDDQRSLSALAAQISVGFETMELFNELKTSQEYKEFIAQEYSHTLKNLLQPVMSISSLLKSEPTDQEMWDLLENEIKKMRTTINTMLHLGRAESAELVLNRTLVNIRPMLQNVIEPYQILARDKSLEIRLSIENDVVPVFMDEQLIYDAVANLLDNAIKYSKENSYINVHAKIKRDNLCISVTDIGEVISNEDREKVFEKFYVGRHNVDKIRQLGLGLTYVKAVVERHDGEVYVDPKFKRGAKIVFVLPLKKEEKNDEENSANR